MVRSFVDVAVGVVAFDSFAEPENIDDTEIIAQPLLDLFARHRRIPIWIEQTTL